MAIVLILFGLLYIMIYFWSSIAVAIGTLIHHIWKRSKEKKIKNNDGF